MATGDREKQMEEKKEKIGMALSGGGIRATIFHLGVIKWMAENNMLGNISRISSVSGASLAIGLIYSHNSLKWPTDYEYINNVLPKIRKIILKQDIQKIIILKLLYKPYYLSKRVNLLSGICESEWGVKGKLSDLDQTPKWFVNCTTFETGKRFKFSQEEMGDYKIGYVKKPSLKIADIVAASAGFPILIGPYKLYTKDYKWHKPPFSGDSWSPPTNKYLHLWDGGVYDNLGMESIFKPDNGGKLEDDVSFIIVSNASHRLSYKKRKIGLNFRGLKRLLDISMNQNISLRSRSVVDYIKRTKNGIFINIGNNAKWILKESKSGKMELSSLLETCLSHTDTERVRTYETTLSRPSEYEFDLILRHGYEVAMCTYACYQ